MISNRDSNNNLTKDALKKKEEMQEQEQNDKEKKRTMIAYISIGSMVVLMIGIAVYNFTGTEKDNQVEFATPETDSDKYNTKLEALEAKQQKNSNTSLLDLFSKEKKNTIVNDTVTEGDLKRQLDALDKSPTKTRTVKSSKKSKKDVYGDYSMWEEKDKNTQSRTSKTATKKALTYAEKLKLAKQARYGNATKTNTATTAAIQKTRVAIFRDQFLLPGQLVELVLTNDFTYNNKLFKKGTPVYGYISINKTRVLFDIQNIAHQPLNIEVRDIRDGLIGMYSSRAGELWKKYETEGVNNTTKSVTGEIKTPAILSHSIEAVSKFFQKKRINKNEKIMLLNDQELIVNILNK